MKSKIFKSAGMVALFKNSKWSLYKYVGSDESETEKAQLIALPFACELPSLEVFERLNLVLTPESVYSLSGQELVKHNGEAKIVEVGGSAIIVTGNSAGAYQLRLTVWNGDKIVLSVACSDYSYSNRYLAVKFSDIWSLYNIDGSVIDEGAFRADEVEIYRNLLIAKRVGNNSLYSLIKKTFLKEEQIRIVCSKDSDFALCAQIGERSISVYSSGKWHVIPEVGEFGVVEGLEHLFYVKRDNKYFIYEDDMSRFMQHLYPDGVDFVACYDGILLVINDGEPIFYNKE